MDTVTHPSSLYAFTAWIILQLLNESQHSHYVTMAAESDEEAEDSFTAVVGALMAPIHDTHAVLSSGLNHYRFCTLYPMFDEEVGYWVRPRSTTWFSRFLLEQYDDRRWIQMFRMSKTSVMALADLLKPHVQRQDTKYRLAIPVLIRVACTLFKLAQGASLFICSEMFAIGKSTVSILLREVVNAINDTMGHEITWPRGDRLRDCQTDFQNLCGLPACVGAIDGTHISIAKPQHGPADYYYFKSGGYTLNCQAVVDNHKRFIDLFLGMPGSTNDARMLRRSSLHELGNHNMLFERQHGVDGFSLFLVGDSGYPLLPWLMVPHRGPGQLSIAELLFNKRLRRGRCVVENAFGILKQTFKELLQKSQLHVTFMPDVILSCAILHNVLLGQSAEDVDELLQVLRREGLEGEVVDEDGGAADAANQTGDDVVSEGGAEVRRNLAVYLTLQRNQGQ